jgi:HEAT repeat protein
MWLRIFQLSLIGALAAFAAMPAMAAEQDDVPALLQAAQSGSGPKRYEAIDKLGQLHDSASQAMPVLQKLLMDKDPQVRWRSARAVGDYGAQASEAAASLRKLLGDKDPVVQYHAVVALGKIGDRSEETTSALVAAATSKDARVARAAVASIRHLKPGPQRVLDALGQALKSNDEAVMLHALEAIVEQGAEAVPFLKEALKRPDTAYLAATAVEHIGPPAADTVPELTELLGKTKHSQLLIQTLLALASIGPAAEPAAPKIVPLLESPNDATVPVAAAYALGAIGAKNADTELKRATMSQNAFLRMVASWALAKNHPQDQQLMKQAVAELTKGLTSKDEKMRTAAAKGLQMLQAPPEMVAPALAIVAKDPDPHVQANIVNALAGLGKSVVPKAANGLQKPELRNLAVQVLTKLGPDADGAVAALQTAAQTADPAFLERIHFALAAIGPSAAPATSQLVKGLSSDTAGVRESALYALRQIGPNAKDAVGPLTKKMESDKTFESMAAAWALARIAPGDADVAAKAVPVLVHGLSDADERTRLESAEALGAWGPAAKPASAALKQASQDDESAAVRGAAEAALARVGASS